jgi:hypothetical protein
MLSTRPPFGSTAFPLLEVNIVIIIAFCGLFNDVRSWNTEMVDE